MGAYLAKQLISLVFTLAVAGVIIFSLVRMVPGDPVIAVIGEGQYTQEQYDATKRRMGLDQPFHTQLIDYVRDALTLDLGTSFRNERPVWQNIVEQLPYTMHLAMMSLVFALVIGLPLGVFAAMYRNTWFDQSAMVGALAALCVPNFLLGLIFIVIFSGRLGWFPSFGTGTEGGVGNLFRHAFIPAVVLGASAAGVQARMTRSALLEVMSRDYIRTARAKGLAERRVIVRHALHNAFVPILTVLGMDLARLLTGTMIIETLFGRLGVGKTLVDAILFRDYPQIQGTLLVFVIIIVVVNTLTDIAYTLVDPRIRVS